MREKVLVYRDYGVGDLTNLVNELHRYFDPLGKEVDFTDAASIIKEDVLNENVALFVMPGGAATPFLQKLKVLGNEKIKNYVENGGHYLGICAGAYYACYQVEFEKDIPSLCIVRSGELLNLVHAHAVGTLYKELNIRPYMKNEASSAGVRLIWQDNSVYYAHYHGGPKFVGEDGNFEVLARYQDVLDTPAAIIAQNYGLGRVVLSGVHFEDRGADLQKALHALRIDLKEAKNIAEVLNEKENLRQILFDKVMASVIR